MLVQGVFERQVPLRRSLTGQEPVNQCRPWLGPWDSVKHGAPHRLHDLFSLIMLIILLAVYIFTLSVTHRTDVIVLGKPIFFSQIFSPKVLWKLKLLRFLLKRLRHGGPFCRIREKLKEYKLIVCKHFMANHPYFCI